MTNLIETAGIYAIVIVAAVEAIRNRVPSMDGWRVLVLAAGISIAIGALFLTSLTPEAILESARVTALAWLVAVGGDAWVAKIVTKNKISTTVFDSREAPTVKEGATLPPKEIK